MIEPRVLRGVTGSVHFFNAPLTFKFKPKYSTPTGVANAAAFELTGRDRIQIRIMLVIKTCFVLAI
jgi:hypothetical protein